MTPRKRSAAQSTPTSGEAVSGSTASRNLSVRETAAAVEWEELFGGTPAGAALDLGAELELAERVRQGISTDVVDHVLRTGIVEPGVVYDHVIPRRTLSHRKDTGGRLSAEQSDRFARVLRLHARAEAALGDADRARRWLRKPNRALEGACPIDLLDTDAGTRAVERVLGRIEHGVYS